jgi:hypothetical protein
LTKNFKLVEYQLEYLKKIKKQEVLYDELQLRTVNGNGTYLRRS